MAMTEQERRQIAAILTLKRIDDYTLTEGLLDTYLKVLREVAKRASDIDGATYGH